MVLAILAGVGFCLGCISFAKITYKAATFRPYYTKHQYTVPIDYRRLAISEEEFQSHIRKDMGNNPELVKEYREEFKQPAEQQMHVPEPIETESLF